MSLSEEEQKYFSQFGSLVGIDEAGRGPLAGPLVVAAVSLDLDTAKELIALDVNDSKKIAESKREKIYEFVSEEAEKEPQLSFAVEEITVEEIDQDGIYSATHKGIVRAQRRIKPEQFTLIDGRFTKPFPFQNYKTRTKGDLFFVSVAAASVIAKVHRDRIMLEEHKKFPKYGFKRHKGYGTKAHLEAIKKFGPCEIHRRSFNPIKETLSEPQ